MDFVDESFGPNKTISYGVNGLPDVVFSPQSVSQRFKIVRQIYPTLVAILVMVAGGCTAPQAVRIPTLTPYDPVAAAYIHDRGPNEIRGQAFLRQRGGAVVTCAGSTVNLIPATNYAKERMFIIFGTISGTARGYGQADQADDRYLRDIRSTVCNAQGDFIFDDVADGDYFVTTAITWEVPTGYGYMNTEGGGVMAPVSLVGGQTKTVVIAP